MRSLILVLSLVLGIVPLVGVVWIFVSGMITLSPFSATVDGLFTTLILLALSSCFLLNAFWEARDSEFIGKKKATATPAKPAPAPKAAAQTPSATPVAKANP
ncbi:MAG TPA: hypothetical protein VFO46_06305 [Candidatus Sulfotelmatobacter sp.]|nr:hypothetical protein [Candidatus Sulfotelmatobacter sp.]